jgi:hypothetical protein
MTWVMAGVATASLVTGIVQSSKENKKAKEEKKKAKDAERRMAAFEASRQPVIDKSDEIRSMGNKLSNPYANLPVATQAAEMQAEQTDQALANTLDTIRATGSGAGGATALAQAAAQSKSKVAASIEQQEATNAQKAAEGEAQLQKDKANIEAKALSEEIAVYGRQEDRDIVQLNRMQTQMENAQQNQATYESAAGQALSSGVGGAGVALEGADFSSVGTP